MKYLVSAVIATLLLSACGGGGSSGGVTTSAAVPNVATPSASSTPTTLSTFGPLGGRAGLTAGSADSSGGFVTVPGRQSLYFTLGTPTVTTDIDYTITDQLPSGLPAFDSTKVLIGVVAFSSELSETFTGPLAFAFNNAANGGYTAYHIAVFAQGQNSWLYNQSVPDANNAYRLIVGNSTTTYTLPVGQVDYAALYADPL